MRLALLAPASTSLYSRYLTWTLAREPGIVLVRVVTRSLWSVARVRENVRLIGPGRLLSKAVNKLVYGTLHRTHKRDAAALVNKATEAGFRGKTLESICRALEIPLLTTDNFNDVKGIELLRRDNIDAIVFTGGGLLRQPLLEIPRIGVLNAHAGMLPRYRGMDVTNWAILEAGTKEPEVGVTIHLMDSGVDTGPLLACRRVEVRPDTTYLG